MKAELGDLDRVTLTLKVVGMVNSNPVLHQTGLGGGRHVRLVQDTVAL